MKKSQLYEVSKFLFIILGIIIFFTPLMPVAFILYLMGFTFSCLERKEKNQILNNQNKKFLDLGFIETINHNNTKLLINDKTKEFAVVNREFEKVFKFQNLLDFEILEDNETVYKTQGNTTTKRKVSLGKAAVGGLLFGAPGAIRGGLSGKSQGYSNVNHKAFQKCSSLKILLTFNSISNPCFIINLINKSVDKKSAKYQRATEVAHKYIAIFKIISQNNSSDK